MEWTELSHRDKDNLVAEHVLGWTWCDGLPVRRSSAGHNEYDVVCQKCDIRWPKWRDAPDGDRERIAYKNRGVEMGIHPASLTGRRVIDLDNHTHFTNPYTVPRFSTTIQQAWHLVLHLYQQGHEIEVSTSPIFDNDDPTTIPHVCRIWQVDNEDNYIEGKSHESVMDAICLAALKVEGVDV